MMSREVGWCDIHTSVRLSASWPCLWVGMRWEDDPDFFVKYGDCDYEKATVVTR